jgi:hypothetical protein
VKVWLTSLHILLVISVPSLTLICVCLIISLLCVNLVFSLNHDLRQVRSCLYYNTALTIATSTHCKPDFLKLNRLQLILTATTRAVSQTLKFSHISLVLKSLPWLKVNECIQSKIFSLIYNVLQTDQPVSLHNFLTIWSASITRSSSVVTLFPFASRLHLNGRSFSYNASII